MGLFLKFFASQLSKPTGLFGRFFMVGRLNRMNAHMNDFVQNQMRLNPNDHVLEIGFGGGSLLEKILSTNSSLTAAGIDLSPACVDAVHASLKPEIKSGRLQVQVGTVEKIPYADQTFTRVCSVNTIYFWQDPEKALSECHRVLRPGGHLLLCFNSKKDLSEWPGHEHGFHLYETSEVISLFKRAGFEKVTLADEQDPKQGLIHLVSGTR